MYLSFDSANRIIEVVAPATTVTIQELWNAICNWSENLENLEVPTVASASGKEDLGGGQLVGITLTLLNWKLKFEDRAGPDTVLCDVSGGNLVAVDENGGFVNPIEPSSYVTVTKTASVAAGLIAEWTQTEKDEIISDIDGLDGKIDGVPAATWGLGERGQKIDDTKVIVGDIDLDIDAQREILNRIEGYVNDLHETMRKLLEAPAERVKSIAQHLDSPKT